MKKFAQFLLVIFLQLLALELTLFLFFSYHQDYDVEMWRYSRALKTPTSDGRSHAHRPDASAELMGTTIRTNALGLRPSAPHSGSPVLVLGDSFTLGWGVPEENTFAALLSSWCQAPFANGGVGNYNLEQILVQAQTLTPLLRPRELLYAFYWNDAEPTQREPTGWLARHSHVFLFWRKIQVRLFHYGTEPGSYQRYYQAHYAGEGWEKFSKAAATLTAFARGQQIPLRVALLPELRVAEDPAVRAIYHKVETLFRGLGVPAFSVDLPIPPGEKYWVASDDPHPNSLAHAAFAQSLARKYWPACHAP